MRVFGDVHHGGFEVFAVFQFDQPLFFQQDEASAFVGRVARQSDGGAVFQFFDIFDFFAVGADGVHEGVADRHEFQAAVFDHDVQIGFVLEGVGVNGAVGEGNVRRDVVVKFDDFDVEIVFFFGDFGRSFDEVGFLSAHRADLEGRGLGREGEAGNDGGKGQFFHGSLRL